MKNGGLMNFYGIFEIKHISHNKVRLEINKLKNNDENILYLSEQLKRIKVIDSFKIIKSLGSLTINFNENEVSHEIIISSILRLLNLDKEILELKDGKLKKLIHEIAKILNISIYNKTNGVLDLPTLTAVLLGAYALKNIKTNTSIPSNATLVWWMYKLLKK